MSLGLSAAAWVAIGTTAASAGASMYSANQASNAQQRGIKNANALQAQNRDMAYTVLEPNRMLGYQAGADLASLYGYATPGYTPLNQLLTGNSNGVYNVGGSGAGGNTLGGMGGLDPAGLFGGGGSSNATWQRINDPLGLFDKNNQPLRGTINTNSGTVDVAGGHNNLDAQMTAYLQGTGPEPTGGHGRYSQIKQAINNIKAGGYTYTPGANGAAGSGSYPGAIAPTPAGQPGNMSRFFTSPDYQFRQEQGTQAIDRSAAARGGALSGNAIRAGTEYAGNLASGEFGNYVNRLLAMAGLGTAATNNVINAGTNAANNMSQNAIASGDARASGIMGAANGITGAINGGLNSYLTMRYLNTLPGMGG